VPALEGEGAELAVQDAARARFEAEMLWLLIEVISQ